MTRPLIPPGRPDRRLRFWFWTCALLLALWPAAAAEQVDLVTLPGRNTVQLTIYNSEDLTLVKEVRHLTLTR